MRSELVRAIPFVRMVRACASRTCDSDRQTEAGRKMTLSVAEARYQLGHPFALVLTQRPSVRLLTCFASWRALFSFGCKLMPQILSLNEPLD
jgi:hypothetical protein